MRSKISFAWSLIAIIAFGVACASGIILFNQQIAPEIIQPETFAIGIVLPAPARLIIPSIGIDAPIESLGLAADGNMAVPVGPTDAAWFDLGTYPGQIGSAVIAGHDGWKDNIAAAFDNLHKLKAGDMIYVIDAKGATTTFVMRTSVTYSENANASGIFASSDGLAHLNLVTCAGTWNATEKSYIDRLVVFADKETK